MFKTHYIDAAIVAAYLILSFVFGLIASRILRSGTKGEEGYFLAGRKMPGWLTGFSTAVTAMNADVAPAYCGMAVVIGLPIAWFYMSRFGLALMIAGLLFAVYWRRLRVSTGPEFYALRFAGHGAGFVRVWTSLFQVFIGMVPWIGAGMLGVHMIFGPIFGIEAKSTTLLIVLPVLLIYVWISGFAGVLVTDLIQSLIIIVANVMVGVLVLFRFGGPGGLADAIRNTVGLPAQDILSATPVPGHEILGPTIVALWFLVPTIGAGGGQSTEGQRIFSCRDEREAAKVYIWTEIVLFLMLLSLTLPALGLLPIYPELYTAEPAQREEAYGMLLRDFLPVGLLGIALAALTASVMSTIDSHLNYGAQTLTNDVWRPGREFFKKLSRRKSTLLVVLIGVLIAAIMRAFMLTNTGISWMRIEMVSGLLAISFVAFVSWLMRGTRDDQALFVGRIFTVIVMIASIVVVYQSKSLIDIAIRLSGIFGATATLGWAQWWWWRVNFYSWLSAMVGGPIIYFGLGPALEFIPGWTEYGSRSIVASQYLAMVQAFAGMIVSTVFWVTITLLTRPEKMENLKAFYLRARPMGFWGPVKQTIEEEQGKPAPQNPKGLMLGGFAAAVLGTSWICLAMLGISQLFVGGYLAGIGLGVASLCLGLIFRKVFHWHYDRLDKVI